MSLIYNRFTYEESYMILLGLIIFLVLYIETRKRIETFIKHKRLKKSMSEMKMTNPNETLMLTFGMGVVMAWVVIAATASYFSIVEQRDISDSQLTVIGLLGGPALLIITSVLDLFKGKESAKIAVLPDRLSADVQATDAEKTHVRLLEEFKMKHDLEMEKMQKQHTLDMEAYQITNKKVK
tara:strand:+ start:2888 stop:3430 length:543 start_codon:yes stop_codon:yes gene_type:complete